MGRRPSTVASVARRPRYHVPVTDSDHAETPPPTGTASRRLAGSIGRRAYHLPILRRAEGFQAQLTAITSELAALRESQLDATAQHRVAHQEYDRDFQGWQRGIDEAIQHLLSHVRALESAVDELKTSMDPLQRTVDDLYESVVVQNAIARADRRQQVEEAGKPSFGS